MSLAKRMFHAFKYESKESQHLAAAKYLRMFYHLKGLKALEEKLVEYSEKYDLSQRKLWGLIRDMGVEYEVHKAMSHAYLNSSDGSDKK